jgi:hypothetical protein
MRSSSNPQLSAISQAIDLLTLKHIDGIMKDEPDRISAIESFKVNQSAECVD